MTAKEYLEQVKKNEAILRNLFRDKERLRDALYSLGSHSEGELERVQSSKDPDKFGALFGRIDEMERKIDSKITELIELELEVSSLINALSDEKNIEVLHRKYIDLQTWDEIADGMEYSRRYVLKIHGEALEEFSKEHAEELDLDTK